MEGPHTFRVRTNSHQLRYNSYTQSRHPTRGHSTRNARRRVRTNFKCEQIKFNYGTNRTRSAATKHEAGAPMTPSGGSAHLSSADRFKSTEVQFVHAAPPPNTRPEHTWRRVEGPHTFRVRTNFSQQRQNHTHRAATQHEAGAHVTPSGGFAPISSANKSNSTTARFVHAAPPPNTRPEHT